MPGTELVRVLTVNAGSSSLKLSVLDGRDHQTAGEDIPTADGAADLDLLGGVIRDAGPVDAVGHRVVHGGPHFTSPQRLDADVLGRLGELADLAPLHQARSLAAIGWVSGLLPTIPAVACFDTGFHSDLAPGAATFALPAEWNHRYGLRRYGFHGLSHAYAARRAAELLGRPVERLRLVTCHLGSGASLAAVRYGRSVDTTMGFTPLDGLVMATRSGSIDPGLLVWLLRHRGISPAELEDVLEHRSGLAGLTGTPDMREVLREAEAGSRTHRLGLEVYLHRLAGGIAAMAAAAGGMDAVVFTGGVGENAPSVRAEVADRLGFLGLALEPEANAHDSGDREVSPPGAAVAVVVVTAREDLEIARQTRSVLIQSAAR